MYNLLSRFYFTVSGGGPEFFDGTMFVTGPPNGPVLLFSLASVGVYRLSSSATPPPGARAVKRTTLHGGPVVLRPVKANLVSLGERLCTEVLEIISKVFGSRLIFES